MLFFFSSRPFYNDNVHLPTINEPTPAHIADNPKFFPFFADCIGATDGTHLPCNPSAAESEANRDRNGQITQNCLAVCDFDMKFLYLFCGWDGSTSDSTMFLDARVTDLPVPPGKYYLADAGFPTSRSLLLPFRGVRYHLAEWGRADLRCSRPLRFIL
jgi:hypothetical protein